MTDLDRGAGVPKKVLVIEDHLLFRDGLTSLFRTTPDFKIVGEAGSIHEGINKACLVHPDIILMDYSLPDGTGLEATKAILAEIPDCKIVFLTVHEADEKLFAAIRAGAKGYLPKNLAGKNLISSLRALARDEFAISRKLSSRIVDEFSRSNFQNSLNEKILGQLSPREHDVLCELQTGISNNEIARRLFISENTVKHHVQNIYKKLGVETRRQASQVARRAGLKSKFSET